MRKDEICGPNACYEKEETHGQKLYSEERKNT